MSDTDPGKLDGLGFQSLKWSLLACWLVYEEGGEKGKCSPLTFTDMET